MSDYRKIHTKEQIEAAINYIKHACDNSPYYIPIDRTRHVNTIITALEAYKQPPASNTEALEALGKFAFFLKDYPDDPILDAWHTMYMVVHTALTNPPQKTVDVEALKVKVNGEDDTHRQSFDAGWNDCIDHLVEKGIINAE